MWARYGGAFGTSIGIHAAVAAWLIVSTYAPPLRGRQSPRQLEVVSSLFGAGNATEEPPESVAQGAALVRRELAG